MVIVWYNCKDKRVSSIVGETIIFFNIYRWLTIVKPYFLYLRTMFSYVPAAMLQEIDDMQAKIVIYLRMFIQLINFNYLWTMFLSTLPWCWWLLTLSECLSWWFEEMYLNILWNTFINNPWYFWLVSNKINDTCLKDIFFDDIKQWCVYTRWF